MSQNVKSIGIKPHAPMPNKANAEQESVTSKALKLCESMSLFHNQENKAYAVVTIDSYQEVFEIAGKNFTRWLQSRYYKANNRVIAANTLKEIITILEAKAFFEGKERNTAIRVVAKEDKIYIDLCNDKRQCVEITADGWRILDRPPVMFVRKEGMSALPSPKLGGNINTLKTFLNIYSDDFPLVAAWILGALRGKPPYPILILQGEQGSGKSTTTEILRKLVDPSKVPLRGVINDERDLVVSATSAHILVMDNTSFIKPQMSDTLCRISTGGGFSRRRLFTDSDEVLIKLSNPIIINGISSLPERPDLLERSICVELPSVTSNRQTHQKIMDGFEAELPKILGALYTALAGALKAHPLIHLEKPPRMADFAYFIAAAEKALEWPEGCILKCMEKNQHDLAENSIESNTYISAILEFMNVRSEYAGTAQELLTEINNFIPFNHVYRQCPCWPKTPHKVGQLLSRYAPYLKRLGYAVVRTKSPDKQSKRIINICAE